MNKSELVREIADRANITLKDAAAAEKAFEEIIKDVLKQGGRVQIVGFGTFEVSKRAARIGTNPATKEKVEIPASKSVKFRAGKQFKDALD